MNEESKADLAGPAELARITTAEDFGRMLTAVRTQAGLTVRQVARAAGVPVSTTGDYFSGRHLPAGAQAEQVLKILRACGVTDEASLSQWTEALRRARRPAGRRASADAPYRGLARFEPADALWFFGREEIAGNLAELALRRAAGAGAGLPLILVGPSGSGKSSLLRAGLVPRLPGSVVILEPSATPYTALEERLSDAAETAALTLIIDQFEMVFTLCQDETQRTAFITGLGAHARDHLVVIALRADFYGQAIRYPVLASALQASQVVLGPMTSAQVRRAISEPARLARLKVEDGLIDLLLRDLAADARELGAYEPGALPLLSHALLATWEQSRPGSLTIAGYLATGGIRHALVQTAENAYGDLSDSQRRVARGLFLRLVQVADDTAPARAAVQLAELRGSADSDSDSNSDFEQVLSRFVSERLITVDSNTAQITHDSLLATWPRLSSWIDSGIQDLRVRRRITDAARAWQGADRESAALLRGSQLAIAREWSAEEDKRATLGPTGLAFVEASVLADHDSVRAARRRTHRLQKLVTALTVLAVCVLGLAGYAFQQRQDVTAARDSANSRATAMAAEQVRGDDPGTAAQLSVAAYRIAPTPQAAASVLESSGQPSATRLLDSATIVQSVSLRPDHKVLAVATAGGTIRLWRLTPRGQPTPIGKPFGDAGAALYTTAFSPDGKILAAAGADQSITLWDVGRPGHPVRLGQPLSGPADTVYSVAFNADGTLLAAGSADDSIWLWDVSDPSHPRLAGELITGAANAIESVAFSPDGKVLAAGSADHTVRLWNVANPARPVPLGKTLTGPGDYVNSVAFSPDGLMLAAGSRDKKVWLWNLRYGAADRRVTATAAGTLLGASNWINAVSFSPDGTQLAAGTSAAGVLVWNTASHALLDNLPQPEPVTSVTWDGIHHLASGDANGTVDIWRLPSPILLTGGPAYDVAYSPNGKTLAVSSAAKLELWDVASHAEIAARSVAGTFVNAVEFAPSGRFLAATYGNGRFRLWRTSPSLTPLSPPLRASAAAASTVETVAFSPDGSLLATGGDDGTLRIWSLRDPARPVLLAIRQTPKTIVFGVAFAPDGKTVAAAYTDRLTRLWDVTDPSHPRLLGHPLPGTASYAVSVAFSPDGELLAVGSADGIVRLWRVSNPSRPVLAARSLTGLTSYVYGVAFSPGGTTLAAAVTDGTVWLWKIRDSGRPRLFGTLRGPTDHAYAVAFAPGGGTLAAASGDGTVRIWDTSTRAALAAACSAAGQPLTRREWASYIPSVPYQRPCP